MSVICIWLRCGCEPNVSRSYVCWVVVWVWPHQVLGKSPSPWHKLSIFKVFRSYEYWVVVWVWRHQVLGTRPGPQWNCCVFWESVVCIPKLSAVCIPKFSAVCIPELSAVCIPELSAVYILRSEVVCIPELSALRILVLKVICIPELSAIEIYGFWHRLLAPVKPLPSEKWDCLHSWVKCYWDLWVLVQTPGASEAIYLLRSRIVYIPELSAIEIYGFLYRLLAPVKPFTFWEVGLFTFQG